MLVDPEEAKPTPLKGYVALAIPREPGLLGRKAVPLTILRLCIPITGNINTYLFIYL